MTHRTWPFLLAGELRQGDASWAIRSPFSGELVGHASVATRADVITALDAATHSARDAAAMPSHARARVLQRIVDGLVAREEEIALLLAEEAGKPVVLARVEIERAIFAFRQGAEEATRIRGESLPTDTMPHGEGRWAITRRFPLAPIAAITPFNFPVLLAAHKLAPAIACGATIVLKPPPQDPLSTLLLAEIIAGAGYPAGAISILPASVEDAAPLIDDPRVRLITFTGSARVGWMLRQQAGTRKVALELGGNAAVIVEPDADIDHAVRRCVAGAFAFAGQSCISTQRILVHERIYDTFVTQFVAAVTLLHTGDPRNESTDVGPMIDEANARRAEAWVHAAVDGGARIATGGTRHGAVMAPTVLLETTSVMQVNCEEIFAPVVTVRAYHDLDAALDLANDSPFGLQAGLFTNDLRSITRAFERLDVGGVIINDVSGFRVDHLPYGGVKQSGLGREGVRYAIEEMTESRLLILG